MSSRKQGAPSSEQRARSENRVFERFFGEMIEPPGRDVFANLPEAKPPTSA
jgi:hypothetical protein